MVIRQMRETEIDFAFRCAEREGWLSETRESFEAFYARDPAGCLVAEDDDRSIGICVATSYGTNGFIGELIVLAEMRGRGIGRRLLEHAIRHLEDRGAENILLDGDLPAVPLYERVGFRNVCRSLRFVGRIEGKPSPRVRPMTSGDLPDVREMDRVAFGADRGFFLERRFQRHPELCRVLQSGEFISGYIMGLPGNGVLSVGPWIVRGDPEEAADLLEDLAVTAGEIDLRIGVLETNTAAVERIRSFGSMESREPSWRMVRGPSDRLGASSQCYAIGTAAKG